MLFESPPAPPNLLGIEKRISETTAIITEFEKECGTLNGQRLYQVQQRVEAVQKAARDIKDGGEDR